MDELRRLYSAYTLRVDDKGRLKLPLDFKDALGEKQKVLVISLAWQTVRIYPIGGSFSQRIVLGKKPSAGFKTTRVQYALLGFGGIHSPIWHVDQHLGFVTEVDSSGRVLVTTHQANMGMENERVRVRWDDDHLAVITDRPDDWPEEMFWAA